MATKNPFDALQKGIVECLRSSKYSDFTIRCEGNDFRVHKLVLCTQSEYFSKLCNGDWKESSDSLVDLKDDDCSVVKAMIDFLYQSDYDGSGNEHGRLSPLLFNVRMYSIADKYMIPSLKRKANEKFDSAVKVCWAMDDFPHAINDIYGSTPPSDNSLRGSITQAAYEHIDMLMERPDFVNTLQETAGFAADLVKLMAITAKLMSQANMKKYKCPGCSKTWSTGSLIEGQSYYCLYCGMFRPH